MPWRELVCQSQRIGHPVVRSVGALIVLAAYSMIEAKRRPGIGKFAVDHVFKRDESALETNSDGPFNRPADSRVLPTSAARLGSAVAALRRGRRIMTVMSGGEHRILISREGRVPVKPSGDM